MKSLRIVRYGSSSDGALVGKPRAALVDPADQQWCQQQRERKLQARKQARRRSLASSAKNSSVMSVTKL
jgi:hypothetical protein